MHFKTASIHYINHYIMKHFIICVFLSLSYIVTYAQYDNQFNSAVYLNNSNDFINCGGANINLGNTFTAEAWIKIQSYPAVGKQYTIISKMSFAATSFSDFPFSLNIGSQGNLFARFSKGDDYTADLTVIDTTPLTLNTWHHVAVSFQGSVASLYHNAVIVDTAIAANPFTISTGTRPLTIGRAGFEISVPPGTTSFIGFIDEVRIWSTERTQSDILSNMNAELIGNETGLIGYWDMNRSGQGTGLTVTNKALSAGFFPNGISSGTSTSPIFINCTSLSPMISASGPVSFCEGGSVTLSSNASTGNLWNTGAVSNSINVTETGNYFVSRSPNTICGSLTSNVISITVLPVPSAPTIVANGPTTFCIGESVELQADQSNGVLWSNNQTGQTIIVSDSGTYSATVTNSQGCSSSSSNEISITVNFNTYYEDSDGDGYGNTALSVQSCTIPAGYAANNSDCNDNNNQVYPGAIEYLNGEDDNCDGIIDNNAICRGGGLMFQKSLGGTAMDDVGSSVATMDGGFAVAGTTSSRNGSFTNGLNTRPDGWITKFNKDGYVLWQKIFSEVLDYISGIIETNDGGFILAGKKKGNNIFFTNDYNISLIKLSSTGNIQWARTYDFTGIDEANESFQIVNSPDGGFLLTGMSNNSPWLCKFNATGGVQWIKYGHYFSARVVSAPDNSIMLVSSAYIQDCRPNASNISSDIIVEKISSNGNTIWRKCFGGNGYEKSYSIIRTPDHHYLIAGESRTISGDVTNNSGLIDVWLLKIDENGNLIWQNSYGGSQNDIPSSVTLSSDNGYVIAGMSRSNDGLLSQNQGQNDYWVFKVDSSGNIQWQRSLGGSGNDQAKSIIRLQDGNFIIAGTTNSANGDITQAFGNDDTWIVKLIDINSQTFYADADQDGYGDALAMVQACEKPTGYVSNPDDCDDARNTIYPGAPEICGNGLDDNCNGQIDEFNPTPALSPISGPTNVCPFVNTGQAATYSVNAVSNATSYVWQVPPFVQIVSGQGTRTVTLSFDAGFITSANKNIQVYAVSPCDVSNTVQLSLATQSPSTPAPIIASSTNVCQSIASGTSISYIIPKVPGASSYIWSVQAGTTTVQHPNGVGENDTIIHVTYHAGFTNSPITVQAVNNCGVSAVRSLNIIRNNPPTPSLISGPRSVCLYMGSSGDLATYSVPAMQFVTDYQWTIPAGATSVSGQGTNSISFKYPLGYTGGSISVTAGNGCGVSSPRTLSVSTLNPSTPSVIDIIQVAACPIRTYRYSLTGMPANAQSVQWTVPANASITQGQGSSSITVTYSDAAINGKVSARAVNACGTSSIRSATVKLPFCALNRQEDIPYSKMGSQSNDQQETTEGFDMQVYPNPSTHEFSVMVNSPRKSPSSIRLLDIQGRALLQRTVIPGNLFTLGHDLKAGTYLIEVLQGNKRQIQKIIKL